MSDTVLLLHHPTTTQNSIGEWIQAVEKVQVFAKVQEVSSSEFFNASQIGLAAEKRFLVFSGDYHGEPIVEHEGLRYGVYRTYEHGDQTEVYVERKGGTNGTSNAD